MIVIYKIIEVIVFIINLWM